MQDHGRRSAEEHSWNGRGHFHSFLFLNVFNQKPPRPSGTPPREGNLLLTKYLDILLVLNFVGNILIISLSYLRKNKIMSEFPSFGVVPKAGW